MKTFSTISPPSPARRHRPLSIEPMVFAALLIALTLGINVALPKVEAGADVDAAHKAQPARTTPPPPQVDQIAQVN